jgi:hypothetical protein
MGDDLAVVHTFATRTEADLAKSALDAAGIEGLVRSDDVAGLRPHMTFVNGAQLLVRVEDLDMARDVLDLPARPQPGEP